jgi:uncharacterized Zn finger protein
MSDYYYGFKPYVSVAERQRKAQREMANLAKKGKTIEPVKIQGTKIATTYWGKAWCTNLESYSDYSNRLPRGRSYVRNGSVVHLEIRAGVIEAKVCGSELYDVSIKISRAQKAKWEGLCRECVGGIGSVMELLQGRFSDQVMQVLVRKDLGLFPSPKEIEMECSCPDWAGMCKHIAAVLYGVGARLEQKPELLFTLRSVDPEDLITQAASAKGLSGKGQGANAPELAESELSSVFGIELDTQVQRAEKSPKSKPAKAVKAAAYGKAVRPKVKPQKRSPKTKRAAGQG